MGLGLVTICGTLNDAVQRRKTLVQTLMSLRGRLASQSQAEKLTALLRQHSAGDGSEHASSRRGIYKSQPWQHLLHSLL